MVKKVGSDPKAPLRELPKRRRMQQNRRQKLVNATITAIHQYGFAESTVARIAALAGISAGNVHHYFGGKDGLLEEAMRTQLDTIRQETAARLSVARTPEERLRAIVESNFVPEIYTQEICTAWLHFVAHATHAPQLYRLSKINTRRLQSNLTATLKLLVSVDSARAISATCTAMIDGFWMHRALGTAPNGVSESVLTYLQVILKQEQESGHELHTTPKI